MGTPLRPSEGNEVFAENIPEPTPESAERLRTLQAALQSPEVSKMNLLKALQTKDTSIQVLPKPQDPRSQEYLGVAARVIHERLNIASQLVA